MPLSTKLTRALGIKHPLIQGGMHYVGYAPLASIPPQYFSSFAKASESLVLKIEICSLDTSSQKLTSHQVAAVGNAGGIGCITALTQPSPEALQAEIQLCKKLSSKPFGVNLTLLPMLQPPNYDAYAQVVEDEMASGQLRMIETAGHFKGLEPFVKKFKAKGAYVIHKCVTIRHAKSAEKVRMFPFGVND